ncbi:preprotein translocase subunit SecY [Myxococcota bacterium]|nr:preprotein translocase subunit SecY [Myxococcota bacterium]MBU1382612.1 preprotein translocase subunit SecY [Myxococcota bacterium]MBU1495829.1 preprotein translocase subunit SecY [Myxococcota bacterium]
MASGFANIPKIPELRKRLLLTLFLLAVYRVGVFVTVPGVDRNIMKQIMSGASGTFLGLFNMFSGGALSQLSIFALGIMPYISASIIIQLLTVVVPHLEQLNKEGEAGRRKINQYTRYGTVFLCIVQGYFMATWFESQNRAYPGLVLGAGLGFRLMTVLTLTAGTVFIMWLGEQITERGIGNGISLIIFAGIVANLPDAVIKLYRQFSRGDIGILNLAIIVAIAIGAIAVITFFERAYRKIPVQYAKRVVGRRMYGGASSHLPLKVNMAGVIPPIFASSLLMFPAQIASFTDNETLRRFIQPLSNPTDWRYNLIYVAMIVFFAFFYTAVTFNPKDVADNMKKQGGFIPGIRPGQRTAEYIDRVLTRITWGGAIYVSLVCVLPNLMSARFNVPFYFGGTSLLIVVGVALDTVQQIEGHLITRHYEGFGGGSGGRGTGPRIRGRSPA